MRNIYNLIKGVVIPIESFHMDEATSKIYIKIDICLGDFMFTYDLFDFDYINRCGIIIYANSVYYHFIISTLNDIEVIGNITSITMIGSGQMFCSELPHWVVEDIRVYNRTKAIQSILSL